MERGSGFYKYVDAKQGLNVYPLLLCWAPKNESNHASVCFSHVHYMRAQSHCLFYICGLWHHEAPVILANPRALQSLFGQSKLVVNST